MSVSTIFTQKVLIDGTEMPLGYILKVLYVEASDIDGSRLLLTVSDMDGDVRDSLGLKYESVLTMTLGDVHMDDGSQFTEKFTVVSDPKRDGDTLLVECLPTAVYELKAKTIKPRFFVDKSPKQILNELIKGYPVHIDGIVGRGTYHLHAGVTASQLIKEMAKEMGARFFYCRGHFYLRAYDYIARQTTKADLEYKNSRAYHSIWSLKQSFSGSLITRERLKNHCYFDITKGAKQSNDQYERRIIPNIGEDKIKRLNRHIVPKLRFEMRGTTVFKPTDNVKLKIHRFDGQRVLDESIPAEQSIIELIHYQHGYIYVCHATTGVVNSD
ncbi:hypothetical protein MHM93_14780 [Pseudoalteromonas sp. MM17-2]|uniref:hypothetical protein n=1 Tax=Pseudoalteromonas sp. MM17-2 TaxID=2917753 RepID=UPI001EF438E0|nr:hypothetical protein [Pseudoalteromonas sp. MM17-2]MCG7545444.1 hypothetical protein [Pseudoalteromonas sp. MM17-2]